jgi:DNA polymerase/3'-5' exonuclease PolX
MTMNLNQATIIAERVRDELAPHCDKGRCVIAGSIRRRKPEVKDVEIVCIPRQNPIDLFGGQTMACQGFCDAVNVWPAVKGSPLGRYTQRVLPDGIKLDIFIARPETWGLTLAIRTGPREFSTRLAMRCRQLGYRMEDGELRLHCDSVSVPEERDLFTILGLEWVEPYDR